MNANGIQNNAVLVDLNISAWTGRKLDKKVSGEIDISKNTKTKAGNYNKHLLAGTAKLDEVSKIVSAVRVWHYEQTLPWSDSGSRLLPMKNFFEYKQTLAHFEQQFHTGVAELIAEYPSLVSAAAFQLGALFNRADYPEAEQLSDKFRFGYVFMPVPAANDFRIETTDTALKELQEQANSHVSKRMEDAMKDIWTRLHDCLSHMSDKLADAAVPRTRKDGSEARTQVFRDSLVNNAVELCGLLTRLNVGNDASLEQARQKLEKAIAGVTPERLREDDAKREAVKAEVDAILKAFGV
jgi:hypothetical protein